MRRQNLLRRAVLAAMAAVVLSVPAAAQTRTFENEFGAVEVPEHPQRIVTTHYANTQKLVELGFTPVGHGAVAEVYVHPQYWEILKDIPSVTLEGGEVNYELIASLEPDLIIEVNVASEERLARLRQIAPVVVTALRSQNQQGWQDKVRDIGSIVNATEKVDALAADLAARQAEIAAEYGDFAAEHPVAVLAMYKSDTPLLFTRLTAPGAVLEPAGAVFGAAGEAVATGTGTEAALSLETLSDAVADADILFYASALDGTLDSTALAEFQDTDLYKRIPAVEADHAFPIGKVTVGSYADANNNLDFYVAAMKALQGQ